MDYKTYKYSMKELIVFATVGGIISFIVLYLFYENIFVCLPLSIILDILFLQYEKKIMVKKRKWELTLEFKDLMTCLVSSLVAGYSMDNAIKEAYDDLKIMYKNKGIILSELKNFINMLSLGYGLDQLLIDLGERSDVEDIIVFSQIYASARKSGGNMIKIMKRTANNINEKIEVKREIQTAVAGKKLEATCMMVIPLGIIIYMKIFSPGFMDPLYKNFGGNMIMTIVLIVYILTVLWSLKIVDIEV